MAAPRRFDHDEARRLRAEGMTYTELARRMGVSVPSVRRVCDKEAGRKMDAASALRLKERCPPCRGGCGRRVWAHTHRNRRNTGYCPTCLGAKLREENGSLCGTEAGYNVRGCRCADCRRASAEARRRRRARERTAA